MITFHESTWITLLWMSTLRLSLAALLGLVVLRCLRTSLPSLHRWVWGAVLVQSVILAPWVVTLPVLEPAASRPAVMEAPPLTTLEKTSEQPTPLVFDGTSASGPSWNVSRMAVRVWAGGAVATLGLLLFSQLFVWRMIRRSVPARRVWQSQLDRLAGQEGIERPLRLRVHPTLGPLLARTVRGYCILVPGRTWESLSEPQRQAILIHELTHLRRGDVWKSFVMRATAAVHWFNPLAWSVVARFDEAAEWACDARVQEQGDGQAASLARALLQLSTPTRLLRLGVSTARGARLGVRIRRLVDPQPTQETDMKKYLIAGFVLFTLLVGIVRIQLIAQDMRSSVSGGAGIQRGLAELLTALADSPDSRLQELHAALSTQAGQLLLHDRLSQRVSRAEQQLKQDIVETVLREHFTIDGDRVQLTDPNDPLHRQLLAASERSVQDLEELTATCRRLAERLQGDDDTTLLVKRFLRDEVGPSFLYMAVLRDRMQPGPAMLAESIGRVLAQDNDGRYYVRPDARQALTAIVEAQPEAEALASSLQRELQLWADELVPEEELHQRVGQATSSPLFAAMIVAESLFEQRSIPRGAVHDVLDQLDQLAEDTAQGLQITESGRAEVERVLDQFDEILPRVEVVRPALVQLRELMADDDSLTEQFKRLLETDIALVAVSKDAELANASADQLVMSVLGPALDDTTGQLRLSADESVREEITEHIQEAFREFRSARRRAAPVRELAAMLEDRELADALQTLGGMLVVKQVAEQKIAEVETTVFNEWRQEVFELADGRLTLHSSAQAQVEQFLESVEQMERELADNDF